MTSKGRNLFNMILAILVAIAAWAFVVINYKPMTEVRYTEVPITYTGLVTLANRGYAVSEANHETVEVKLQQRRVDTASITADDIFVTADVSGLTTGENTVALEVVGPEGTQVLDVSLKTVTVNIDSAASETMDISFEYDGSEGEGEVPVISDVSAETATVIATEDKLEKIDRIAAVIDPDDISGRAKHLTLLLKALDKDGNEVINVVIEPETVAFRALAGEKKKASLNVPVKDESDDMYERTVTVPESVTIIGGSEVIGDVTVINTEEIDITYIYEDTEIPLECILPEGIYLDDDAEDLVLKVRVTEKVEEESQEDN